jgi:hypothetical protein
LDLSVGIALGSASQIALFVAPALVLASYFIGPAPMDLQFWPGAVVMMLIATLTAFLVTNSGRSAWFVGVLVLMVYSIFALRCSQYYRVCDRIGPAAIENCTGDSADSSGRFRGLLPEDLRTGKLGAGRAVAHRSLCIVSLPPTRSTRRAARCGACFGGRRCTRPRFHSGLGGRLSLLRCEQLPLDVVGFAYPLTSTSNHHQGQGEHQAIW